MAERTLNTEEILAELMRRKAAAKGKPIFLDGTFPAQDKFIADPARLKVALCTRRAGKSFSCGKYLYKEATETSGVKCLYVGKTRASAKNIMWDDILKVIDTKMKLNSDFKLSELKVELPNASSIQLIGADANQNEIDKVLGQKFKLVIIDEAEAFLHLDLRKMIYVTLAPAMLDNDGTIVLTGMPNDMNYGLFYDVTTHEGIDETSVYGVKKWSLHKWSTTDNPFMREKFIAEMAKEKLNNPNVESTTSFKQSWLGQWTVSDTALVYTFDRVKNTWNGVLPNHPRGDWHYVMGMDTGWTDATAIAVGAYHDFDKTMYVMSTFKQSEMPFDDVVRKLKVYFQQYPIERIIIDPANKHIVQSLKARIQLPIESAEKEEKMANIKIMNSDLSMGRIKFGPDTQSVQEEYAKLVKGDDGKEDPRCKNDSADSVKYLWKYCYHFLSNRVVETPKLGTTAWHDKEVEESMARADKQFPRFTDPYSADPMSLDVNTASMDDFYTNTDPFDFYGK